MAFCPPFAGFLLSFFAGGRKKTTPPPGTDRAEAHLGFVQVAYALPFHGASGPTMRGGNRRVQGAEDDDPNRCRSTTVGFEGVKMGLKGCGSLLFLNMSIYIRKIERLRNVSCFIFFKV